VKINFLVNPVFDGWEPTDTRLGGTERAVVEWSEELVKRGHEVFVYKNGDKTRTPVNGVRYNPREWYEINYENDICINIKSPDIPRLEPTIFYTNDVDADKQDLSPYDAVVHISQWAKDNISVNNPNVFIVPHGYDPKMYYPDKKFPKQCLYASSPDRGLDTLLEAWPKVMAAHPDATLLVTYGATGPELPGVNYLGDVDETLMADLFRSSEIWCHPCSGGELYCISGIKAQACGSWPVIIPTMALAETVKFGTFSTKESYADDLIKALDGANIQPHPLPKQPTIADSTDVLLNVINKVKEKNEQTKQSPNLRK
jgi:glycosyltransferase involved in cell wall biosynthesis